MDGHARAARPLARLDRGQVGGNGAGDVRGVLAYPEEKGRLARVEPRKPDEAESRNVGYAAARSREAQVVEHADVDPAERGPEAPGPKDGVDAFRLERQLGSSSARRLPSSQRLVRQVEPGRVCVAVPALAKVALECGPELDAGVEIVLEDCAAAVKTDEPAVKLRARLFEHQRIAVATAL